MQEPTEFETFNVQGEPMGVVKGVIFEHYGPRIACKGGLIVQAADVIPAEGGSIKTVYVDTSIFVV